jgi:hypothetical protein
MSFCAEEGAVMAADTPVVSSGERSNESLLPELVAHLETGSVEALFLSCATRPSPPAAARP